MDTPTIIKLIDFIMHIANDTRVCIKCRFRGMIEYQKFYGMEASKLPIDVLDSLCVEKVTVELNYFPDGIVPTLVIYAADDVSIVTFDANELFRQFFTDRKEEDHDPEDTEEI